MAEPTMVNPVLDFWNGRSKLGERAGTNDFMLTKIEQDFIASMVRPRSRVLDIGCGNGMSLIRLAKENQCHGVGIDFAEGMVREARERIAEEGLGDQIDVHHRIIPPVPVEWGLFDVALSQRCLINLESTEAQRQAVLSVPAILRPRGTYVMIECSADGAENTNVLRRQLGLEPIEAPWHNLFLNEAEVESWATDDFYIETMLHISSTYHFLSRVVYAKYAADRGEELAYDSAINKIALQLPQQIGEFGPVKAWIWRKRWFGPKPIEHR